MKSILLSLTILLWIFTSINFFGQSTSVHPFNFSTPLSYSSNYDVSVADSQLIDINVIDTSLYSRQPNIIPVGGYQGWEISIMDYNNDGSIDFFGNWFTDSTTTGYSKSAMAEVKDSTIGYDISFFSRILQ